MLIFCFLLLFCWGEKQGTAIGIDLGTTYSCVGVVLDGKVKIITNNEGLRTTPSWVAFTDSKCLVGEAAKNQAALNPVNTIYDIKRFIGRRWSDEEVQNDVRTYPFRIVNKKGKPHVNVTIKNSTNLYSPEELSAIILKRMKIIAESFLGHHVENAVITCPAYFNDAQRQATRDAGKIAGLNVLRVINEPTAAGIAYGIDRNYENPKNVIVFDLGGGTLDVSLMKMSDGKFDVLGTHGNTHLGGEDFDTNVLNYFIKLWNDKMGVNVVGNNRAVQRLWREVEKAKRILSTSQQTEIEISNFFNDADFIETLTRAQFEKLNSKLFRSILPPIEQVLKDANMRKSDVDEVVMVGGSSRIPKIVELVTRFFDGKTPMQDINPDEAIAYGAAVQAWLLGGEGDERLFGPKKKKVVVTDRTPRTVGVAVYDPSNRNELKMSPIIPIKTVLPCSRSRLFTTPEDLMSEVVVEVYEGENDMVNDNRLLGEFLLSGFAKAPRPQINVTFSIDEDGIINVTAVEQASGVANSITIKWKTFSDVEMEMMQEKTREYAAQDESRKRREEVLSKLEGYMHNVKAEVESVDDNHYLDKEAITEAVEVRVEYLKRHMDAEQEDLEILLTDLQELIEPRLMRLREKNHRSHKDL